MLYLFFNVLLTVLFIFFFKQKTAYEMRISDWSSDVCSSDLATASTLLTACASTHGQIDAEYSRSHASISASNSRSEEHTSELQSLMRISYAVFCLKKKNKK